MAQLLKYTLADGQILGCFTSDQTALVEAQAIPDAATGYYLPDVEVPVEDLAHWELVGGALSPKDGVVLTATPNPFPADGVTECAVTVVPFQPCLVTLNGAGGLALTLDDRTLVLTAETPLRWTVALPAQPGVWAEPIVVEAV